MVLLYWMMSCIGSVLKAPSRRLKLGTLKLHIYLKNRSHPDFMTTGPESPYTQFRPAETCKLNSVTGTSLVFQHVYLSEGLNYCEI